MFEDFRGELKEYKLRANENAEKAEHLRKALESVRLSKEQEDRQVIDLLKDIRSRYDTKLNSYMGKNNKKNNKANNSDKSNHNEAQSSDKQGDTWTTPSEDKNLDSSWGAAVNNEATDDAWGASTNNKDNSNGETSNNQNQDDEDWGESPTTPAEAPKEDDTNKDSRWGTSNGTDNDNSWDTPINNNTNKKDNNSTNNKKDDSNKKNNTQAKTTPKKGDSKVESSQKKDDAKKNLDNKKEESPKKESPKKEQPKKELSTKAKGNQKKDESKDDDDTGKTSSSEQQNKEFLDMKSALWTAKLDLRLSERDKAKLAGDLAEIKTERDNLLKKLAHANEEQDTLRVKVRGLTVDLVAANDEIHKLNERIDEIENERRSRERDASFGDSKRKAMENKFRCQQQRIDDLETELRTIREERDILHDKMQNVEDKNRRLEADLILSRNLVKTLKDGCALVEDQARTFEVRHDTVVMTKTDLERELIAIKEESSRHITTINKLQKSNEQLSRAFVISVEAHDQCKREMETMRKEYQRKLDCCQMENLRCTEANTQLKKLVDYLQKKVKN